MQTGGLRCWGDNVYGQVGDGVPSTGVRSPSAEVMTGVRDVAGGSAHTCALTVAGGVRCWGANSNGQLGDRTLDTRSAPPATDVLTSVQAIATAHRSSVVCALLVSGAVRCWGGSGPVLDGGALQTFAHSPAQPIEGLEGPCP
jgi:alpha-tubulin suppressor-like RCC1 family protein